MNWYYHSTIGTVLACGIALMIFREEIIKFAIGAWRRLSRGKTQEGA
jgi:hypothetical protein